MSANAPPDEALRSADPDPAPGPLRVLVAIAAPARAERLRSMLALFPGVTVVAGPDAPADLVVAEATPAVLRALAAEPSGVTRTPLTPRECEVLELLATGASNKMIARRLNISVATTKFHVAALLARLGARSRSDAVAVGVRRGLLML